MTATHTSTGQVVHFPPTLATDAAGMIVAPAVDSLPALAGSIAPSELLLFTKRLIHGAKKKRLRPQWAAVNQGEAAARAPMPRSRGRRRPRLTL